MNEADKFIQPAVDHIRVEQPGDSVAIDRVVREAFGRDEEMLLVQTLRDGGYNLLSLVAIRSGEIVGHLLFTRLPIQDTLQSWDAVALAPLAVLPDYQRQGVGSELMEEGLRQLKARGEKIVVVLGHEHYYTKFGFRAELARPLQSAFSGPSWMAMELVPGSLKDVTGRVRYAGPFGC